LLKGYTISPTLSLARRPLPCRKRSDGAATGGRAEALVGRVLKPAVVHN
jgi:hypothetical protein